MLQLSENAAVALEAIRRGEGIPESNDTRLVADPQPSGDLAVRLEFVEEAEEGDQVTEQGGTAVHIDPQVAGPLADSVLDVKETGEGLALVFRPQTTQD